MDKREFTNIDKVQRKVITKFEDLPLDIQEKFGKEISKDTPAMFISASPRNSKRKIGAEVAEDFDRDFFGDDAFKKGEEELKKLSADKSVIVNSIIPYMPFKDQKA